MTFNLRRIPEDCKVRCSPENIRDNYDWCLSNCAVYASDVNNVINAIRTIRNMLIDVCKKYNVDPKYAEELDPYLAKLTYVKHGDIIMPEHHNTIVDVLFKIRDVIGKIESEILKQCPFQISYSFIPDISTQLDVKALKHDISIMLDWVHNVRVYNVDGGYWITTFDPNMIRDCNEWYNAVSQYNPPQGICEELYTGWDVVWFVEDTKPLGNSDQDFEDVVIRMRKTNNTIVINVLHGEHGDTLQVYFGGLYICEVPPRSANKFQFEEIGTWEIDLTTRQVTRIS